MKQAELVRLQSLNIELLDANRNLLSYLIQVYRRNGITTEEFNHAKALLAKTGKALGTLNGKPYQPRVNTKNDQPSSKQNPNFGSVYLVVDNSPC